MDSDWSIKQIVKDGDIIDIPGFVDRFYCDWWANCIDVATPLTSDSLSVNWQLSDPFYLKITIIKNQPEYWIKFDWWYGPC